MDANRTLVGIDVARVHRDVYCRPDVIAFRLPGDEAGGVDHIAISDSRRSRMAGRGPRAGMPASGRANEVVREPAPEILTAAVPPMTVPPAAGSTRTPRRRRW